MRYNYRGINNRNGYSSSKCTGSIDEKGYVYNGINSREGFSSSKCVGRVDEKGYVYNGINSREGFSSSKCVGRVDEKGYVYNGINSREGFSSSKCVGRVDEKGYVYNGINSREGFISSKCVGKVNPDGQRRAAGASMLLLSHNIPSNKIEHATLGSVTKPEIPTMTVSPGDLIPAVSTNAISAFFSSLGHITVSILSLILFLGIPVSAVILGVYLPYDIYNEDTLGFGEYGPIFIFSYGISLIPLWVSFFDTLFSKISKLWIYISILYLIPLVLLFTGALAEGRIWCALLSFVPAIILFVLPALLCMLLNGIADFIADIVPIEMDLEIVVIGAFVVSVVLSILGGLKLNSLDNASVNRINEQFGIDARVPEGPLYTLESVGDVEYEVQQRALEIYTDELTRNESRLYFFVAPRTGNYRFEIDDCNYEVALDVSDMDGRSLAHNNHCSNGDNLSLFGLTEGQGLFIEAKVTSWTVDYSLLIIEDLDISHYKSVRDNIKEAGYMNSYSFCPSCDGYYKFEIKAEESNQYTIDFANIDGRSNQHREGCIRETGLEVYLTAGENYKLDIYSEDGEISYTIEAYYMRENTPLSASSL